MRRKSIYVLYHGDDVVDVGPCEEVAERVGISPKTLSFYASPACARRIGDSKRHYYAIRVTDDEWEDE